MACVCAKLEAEIAELDEADRAEMLSDVGLEEPSLNVIARQTYVYSSLIMVAAAVIAALVVRLRIDQLDLIRVLKTRE